MIAIKVKQIEMIYRSHIVSTRESDINTNTLCMSNLDAQIIHCIYAKAHFSPNYVFSAHIQFSG